MKADTKQKNYQRLVLTVVIEWTNCRVLR